MSLELWTTIGTVGTFFVIGASAVAALIQLRHMRTNNQLQAILAIERDFHEKSLQDALCFVERELAGRMRDKAFREQIVPLGFIDAEAHPEMKVCNWLNNVGMLVKSGFIDEAIFFDTFGRLVGHCWTLLEPTIALLRRNRGPAQYESFEYLALRARVWRERHPNGTFPKHVARAVITDPWLAEVVPTTAEDFSITERARPGRPISA